MQPVIQIRNLGKQYKMAAAPPYLALRDFITANIFQSNNKNEKFWALKNINADIIPGDRIGIIGRNGAGKSTLLKIISRITPPTTGEITIKGRVGSLLEVGTGFHPELTGRENIFLNGSILGLKRKEIIRQLDAIIAFSGVEKFIDAPLKHFSSGMQMRLAFSVAAHLEPEILLIDEVLAVGDIEFQRKCIAKMEEVSHSRNRTIVFVSHNLTHLKQLCNKAILLDKGKMISTGEISKVITDYSLLVNATKAHIWKSTSQNKDYRLEEISVENENGSVSEEISAGNNYFLKVKVTAKSKVENTMIAIRYTNQDGVHILTTTNADAQLQRQTIDSGQTVYRIPVPADLFVPGIYSLEVAWFIPHVELIDGISDAIVFEIKNDNYSGFILQDGRLEVINKPIRWEKC